MPIRRRFHAVTLTFDIDLERLWYVIKFGTNFDRNRTIHDEVIDNLANFRRRYVTL